MPLFFESIWAIMQGNLSFFPQAIGANLFWFLAFVLGYFLLQEKHSILGLLFWIFGLLAYFDLIAFLRVPSFLFAFPFYSTIIAFALYSVVPEKHFFTSVLVVFAFLPVIFLI